MSRGALLQLIAKGEIDDYLIDNDMKHSLFHNTIKKTTNFSEAPTSFYSSNGCCWGDTVKFTIKKVGDLLSNMYLVLELPNLSVADIVGKNESILNSKYRVKWNDYIGNVIIENVILRIGGQKIDEMSGEYMQFYTNLYDMSWSKLCMLGHNMSLIYPQTSIDNDIIYIPIRFFFCNDISKALPVVALEYHEIEIEIKLREWDYTHLVLQRVINRTDANYSEVSKMNFAHTNLYIKMKPFLNLHLDCNYIFLDADERKMVAGNRYEYLITQTQSMKTTCQTIDSIYLNFTNPIKELIFALQRPDYASLGELYNYSGKPKYIPIQTDFDPNGDVDITDILWFQIPDKHLLDTMNIEINGIERVENRDYKYWHYVQNYEHYRSKIDHNLYMYSFGLTTKENMGSCNFSMLDSIKFNIKLSTPETFPYYYDGSKNITVGPNNNTVITIYGNNYNIFVIDGGMGALMYAI